MSFSPLYTENKSSFDKDLATFSNYLAIRTTHIDLKWEVDLKHEVLHGSATLKRR
jgi:leukotriene-A4 hydrolase